MLRHHQYTRERLSQLADRIAAKIYSATVAIENVQVSAPVDRISHDEAQKLEFRPVVRGEQFGPRWTTFWFKVQATVPAEWRGRVDLQWISFSEVTLWINGCSTQGLNHEPVSWDGATRPDAVLLREAAGGETIDFMIEMACNGMFGDSVNTYKTIQPYILDVCELRLFDPEAWKLYYDFHVLQQLELEEKNDLDKTWAGVLLSRLNQVANILDVEDRATWPVATAILDELYTSRNATTVHELSAIGHAHIDTAWLWPMAETWRKCERSFSTADSYMIEYSEYKFSCSQVC